MKISNETKIGFFAIVVILGIGWLYQFLKGRNILTSTKVVFVEFRDVDGLRTSTPCTINGFQVGVVKDMYLKADDQQTIICEINIDSGVEFPKTAVAEIYGTGLMGGRNLRLAFDKPCAEGDCAETGDYLKGRVVTFLESAIGAPENLTAYTDALSSGLSGIMDTLTHQTFDPKSPAGLGKSIADINRITAQLERTTIALHALIASPQLKTVFNDLAAVTSNLRESNAKISGLLSNAEAVTAQIEKADIGKTLGKANTAMDGLAGASTDLKATLATTEKTVAGLDSILTRIRRGEGSLGKLASSEPMAKDMELLIKDLHLLMQDLRLNPKRYINVSVFGKKQRQYDKPEGDPGYKD